MTEYTENCLYIDDLIEKRINRHRKKCSLLVIERNSNMILFYFILEFAISNNNQIYLFKVKVNY